MPTLSPQLTLVLGILLSLFLKSDHPLRSQAKNLSSRLLQLSVVLLGSALNFHHVISQGASGVGITFCSIVLVFLLGFLGMRLFRLEPTLAKLMTAGTAICGGSAIGALAPVLKADVFTIGISMGTVFLLNALAVFIFPPLGQWLELSQEQFGMFAALAIHDTSAVVSAASIYGETALSVASTVKLTRALWIIPLTLFFSVLEKRQQRKITIPWFVLGFLLSSLAFTFIGPLYEWKSSFMTVSKLGFSLTLFLIGVSFDLKRIRTVGAKPFLFGVSLWISVIALTLIYLRYLN